MSEDGGPAFPIPGATIPCVDEQGMARPEFGSTVMPPILGMSLRDYFAAAVIKGIYAANQGGGWGLDNQRAELAYRQADAMLAERDKS